MRREGEIEFDDLANRLSGHTQVLCIVNTRKLAQKLYKALQGEGTYHLSTLMYPEHRRAVLKAIRERLRAGMPCRVISTSLIEAGVDVSFPALYREEAGLDSVIQAAGRCNREGKWAKGESLVHVFRLSGAEASRPPAMIKQGMSVARYVFEQYEDAASLEAIHAYFEGLYSLKKEALDQKQIMAMTAERIRILSIPFRKIEKAFQLIESSTFPVIIAITDEAKALADQLQAGDYSREILRRLGTFSVNVYEDHLRALYQAGAIAPMGEDCWLLREEEYAESGTYYDPDMGLMLDVETGIGHMI